MHRFLLMGHKSDYYANMSGCKRRKVAAFAKLGQKIKSDFLNLNQNQF